MADIAALHPTVPGERPGASASEASSTADGPAAAGEPGRDRRGPLRPGRLQSARRRVNGAMLARFFQLGDLIGLLLVSVAADRIVPLPYVLLIAAPLVAFLALAGTGAYAMNARESLWRRWARQLVAVAAAGGGGGMIAGVLDPGVLAVGASLWSVFAAAMLFVLHGVWFLTLRHLREQGRLTPNLIIVGATPMAQRLIRRALATRDVNILGIFDDRAERTGPTLLGVPVLGATRDILDHRILPFADRIVITVPARAEQRIAQLIESLSPAPNPISLLLEDDDGESEARAVARLANFDLRQVTGPRERGGYLLLKRAFDVTVGVLGLIALAPLLGVVALAIRLDSPGPVFFRQRRHGYLNEEIVVWKFRSMRVDAADATASRQVTAGDDRVTRVGRFIRKTSLDELPQILNVIAGEMSLVGPRPHAIGMLSGGAEASKLVRTYAHRHRIKPGLTGWAAVNGSRGPVDSAEAVQRRVALDLEYAERRSFWLDLQIMFRTVPCLLGDTQVPR